MMVPRDKIMVVALFLEQGAKVLVNDDCGEFCDLIIGEDAGDGDDSREDDAEVEVVIRGLLVGWCLEF